MATDKESLTARFRAMRFNDNKHLGLGDVRLTLWEQEQIEKEFATLRAENERLKEDAVYIYNSGYNAGHHDTVEGQYTQVLPVDMRTYQNDVVAEILLEVGYDAARREEG